MTLPILLLLAGFAHALPQADLDLRELISARSVQKLEESVELSKELSETRMICRLQLESAKIPTKCFQLLEVERKARLIGAKEFERENRWINELCLSTSSRSNDQNELYLALNSPKLSNDCRDAIRLRRDDLRYADQSSSPAELFENRFQKTSSDSPLKVRIQIR